MNTLNKYLDDNPEHPLIQIIELGKQLRLPYLAYYEKLQTDFEEPENCEEALQQAFHEECSRKIHQKADEDANSRLGVYLQVNPQLETPKVNYTLIPEFERRLVTRYRTGSHNLKIESGRLCNPTIPREERICTCGTGVQSLHHCLFDCPLLEDVHTNFTYTTIEEALASLDAAKLLMEMENMIM